jgi:cytidylate kinase
MTGEKTGDKKIRIAISGKSGCGNTTVSSLLAKALGVTLINYTFRSLSNETGLSLEEIIQKAKTSDWYDRQVDTKQVELAMQSSCVLGSRLAIWMLKEADLKIFLLASENVRTARIQIREGGSLDDVVEFTRLRDAEDTRRYKELYNIDNNDYSFADLTIDTEHYEPQAIVKLIIAELRSRKLVGQINLNEAL